MKITLSKTAEKFILHWGEMGSHWGLSRTVAQIHALLYLSERPLQAVEIMETLGVARSNVSTSLKELQTWDIVRVTRVLGDRRDHFECEADVWEMFRMIVEERKKREIDPTLKLLRECVDEAGDEDPHIQKKLEQMLEFFQVITNWYTQLQRLPLSTLKKFVRMGHKIQEWFGVKI